MWMHISAARLVLAATLTIVAVAPGPVSAAVMPAAAPIGMPTTDLDGWRLVFADDFAKDVRLGSFPEAVSNKWDAYPAPWADTSGHGTYDPHRVVSIDNGVLTEQLHTTDGSARVAAISPKLPSAMTYGRYSVRYRTDALAGYKAAWLLWPDSDNSARDGEIDFPEMDLDSPTTWAFDHRTDSLGADDQAWFNAKVTPGDGAWHTATIEWSPHLVVFILDGAEIGRNTVRTPDTAMHWVLQTETALNSPRPAAGVRGEVQIDWVAAWAYDTSAREPLPSRYAKLGAPAVTAGATTLTLAASPGVTEAKWVLDGVEIGYDDKPPFTKVWDSTKVPNGIYPILSKANDGDGWIESAERSITVNNPKIVFHPPARASGLVTLTAVPSRWVDQVKWVVDGREVGSRSSAPWTAVWDSTETRNGRVSIYAKGHDATGWFDLPDQTIVVTN